MVLGKLPVPGRPTIWITVGQGHTALAVGGEHFYSHLYFSVSPSLWETARYRLKYCLKGPLNPKQPTNQIKSDYSLPKASVFSYIKPAVSQWEAMLHNRGSKLTVANSKFAT